MSDRPDDFQSKAGDLVRKILTVGVGALFLTEESLRTMVSEFKLPKELLTGLLDSAGKTKNEFLQKVGSEVVAKISEKVDPQALVQEILSKHDIRLEMKIRLEPRDKGASRRDPGESEGGSSI